MLATRRRAVSGLASGLLAGAAGWVWACGGALVPEPSGRPSAELTVRRSDFAVRLLLTGELVAEGGAMLGVPTTVRRQLQIRRLAEDGASVSAGDPVIEFDNSSFASDLEEKRLSLIETTAQLETRSASLDAELAEATFAVEQRRAELAKARLDADLPGDLLARRELETRRVALKRAEVALAKAESDLAAKSLAAESELAELRLDRDRRRSEIAEAEAAIRAATVVAPVAGVFLVGEHPWSGRKLREGDQAWPGLPVGRIPDFARLAVAVRLADVDHGRLVPGSVVRVWVDAWPEESFQATVRDVAPIAREDTTGSDRRFFAVTLEPAAGAIDPSRFRPGMSVRVEALSEEKAGALLAPRLALDESATPPCARRADGSEAQVELGPCNALVCVVLSGLAEGDRLGAWEEG